MQPTHLDLPDEVRQHLESLIRRPTTPQRLVLRARCALMVAGCPGEPGKAIREVARELGWQPRTVRKWVARVRRKGVHGLADDARSGRPRRISSHERAAVVAAACASPAEYGLAGYTKWSGALLASALQGAKRVLAISGRSVNRILQTATIKPHRIEYWKRRQDPDFDRKAAPILDLYQSPPEGGIVVCADEMTAIQALERISPDWPPRKPGHIFKREFEYIRHGTVCLTAALFVHTGKTLGLVTERRPKQVFIQFLDLLHAEVPQHLVIHLILDNLNTHKGDLVARWLRDHPGRLQIYYLPFYASWLNQVELWLRTLQRRCLAGGNFCHVDELRHALLAFIDTYNRVEAHVYRWTYSGEVLAA